MWCATASATTAGPSAGSSPAPGPELETTLARLAERAALHRSLLYKLQCNETITRMIHRSVESGAGFGFQPRMTAELQFGVVVGRDKEGRLREERVELDGKGRVRMTRKGEPRLAELRGGLAPLARAFPHAQVAWFTADYQKELAFRLLKLGKEETSYRLGCAMKKDLLLEFLDAEPPRRSVTGTGGKPRCDARPSGQMCLDPSTGEIRAIAFYGLYPEGEACLWDLKLPFAVIEQDLVERSTGARFPSRVRTVLPLDWRDTAVFVQTYDSCRFAEVEVTVELSSPSPATRPPE